MELDTQPMEIETETFEELLTLRRALHVAHYENPIVLEQIEAGIQSYLFGPGDR
ncbi:MAG: hypothetical protein PHE50_00105 [Dehalococcoidales bacterium]|nr:hypothetical protein [Dehalococcoidales bacterium]